MKKIVAGIFIVCLTFISNLAVAQHSTPKIGYTSMYNIFVALPEAKVVESELKSYQTQLETQMKSMSEEFEKKFKDYQAKIESLAPAIREVKEKELQTLRQSITDFEQKAQQDLQKKQQALTDPVYTKIQKAIDEIAKAEHYTHVVSSDVSGFPCLLYTSPSPRDGLLSRMPSSA